MTFSCEQLSGFAGIDFYLLSETSNWPLVLTDQNSSQVFLMPEENGVEGAIDENSINVDANPKESAEGTVYPISISFRFINRSESLEQLLEQYSNKPGIAIGQLNSEFQKMYGSNEEPLYLSFRVDEGEKPDGNGAVIVTIKGETRQRPVYYTVPE
jgi:hypothetical protein